MNSFSFNRYGKTLRWVLSVNFRTLLLWTIGAALVVFLGELLTMKLEDVTDPYNMINEYAALGCMLLVIASLVLISSIVISINNKRRREAFLMLPSTNLEKFLSLVTYTTIIGIACVILAIVLGDSLRMFWFWASGYSHEMMGTTIPTRHNGEIYYWYSSAFPKIVDSLTAATLPDFEYPAEFMVWQALLTTLGLLWLHSLYTLGGTFLRKYAFVGTTLLLVFCVSMVAKLQGVLHLSTLHIQYNEGNLEYYTIGTLTYILCVLFLLLTVFNYWASFRIFKGFQLITNKWTNYDILKR